MARGKSAFDTIESESGVVRDVADDAAGRAAVADLQRANTDRRAAAIGVGAGRISEGGKGGAAGVGVGVCVG